MNCPNCEYPLHDETTCSSCGKGIKMCQLKSKIDKRIQQLEQDARASELMPAMSKQNTNARYQELKVLQGKINGCLSANQYQQLAARTLISEPGFEIDGKSMMLIWCAVGLGGESGEVLELMKKGIFHQHGLDVDKLKKELGDVCWYLAGICTTLGLDLGEIMQMNIEKLIERYPNGFNSDDSIKRVDVKDS